jgi:hypothetical protein
MTTYGNHPLMVTDVHLIRIWEASFDKTRDASFAAMPLFFCQLSLLKQ